MRTWIDELHRNLHLGEPGRLYSELAASWLGVVVAAGLLLWWTGRRTGSRIRPTRTGSARRRALSWHGALGTWAALGFVMLSVTGLTWSTCAGANVSELRTAWSWDTPQVVAEAPESTPDAADEGLADHHDAAAGTAETAGAGPGDSPDVGYQAAFETARSRDLTGPVEVTGPVEPGGTYLVQQLDSTWPTRADTISLDPASGQVLDTVRLADYPFMAKMASWGIDLHMGLLFGLVSQVGMFLLAVTLVVMIVTGCRMWWSRRPTRGHTPRMGRPPHQGAWRSLPPTATAVLAVLVVGLGWFLPVLGVSLLVFLAVDVAVGLFNRRRGVEGVEGVDSETVDAGRSPD